MVASLGGKPLFDVVLGAFHDDDGIVDDNADGQNQGKQGDHVHA